jgi:hypothetical protein
VDIIPLQMQLKPDLDLDTYGAELIETFLRATRAESNQATGSEDLRRTGID